MEITTVKVAAIQLTAQSLLPVILICFVCKETSGRPEVSRRWRRKKTKSLRGCACRWRSSV